ncbi:hypothetical protein AKJ51_00110 [candidate division MSBL1 archaeon SCGC-AAA382A20]|uniref:Transposase n=1 Tax=candidate division MSBL1 archaeon SCGC-AAA382A20 TaxID=1698280 RepID=A0A133VMW7_9EURY|nr:hypothetical protein AKJ51_00110 [candidate division MSBL1 archaeon SCGC-AAA382A20]
MSKGQKAILAAEIKPIFENEAKQKQRETGKKYGKGFRKFSLNKTFCGLYYLASFDNLLNIVYQRSKFNNEV